jgi:hypothetical protein
MQSQDWLQSRSGSEFPPQVAVQAFVPHSTSAPAQLEPWPPQSIAQVPSPQNMSTFAHDWIPVQLALHASPAGQ